MTAKFNLDNLGQPFEADWPVVVSVPQDGGVVKEETFTVRFRLLGDEDKKAAEEQDDTARETLRRAMVGLGKGEERELTDALKEQLLEPDFVRVALARAYGKFCTGIAAKN